MQIFGKDILIKNVGCNLFDEPGKPISPSVNLFVKVTKGCNAHCLFCSNAGTVAPSSNFNIDKLIEIIYELQAKNIIVNRVNITGGEPSMVSPLVIELLQRLEEKDFDGIHVHLNTNGLLRQSQLLMTHPRWDSISMSLHHYDLDKLSKLYGCNIPANAFEFEEVDKQKLNVSCNLIKGYIDNAEEAHKMLDFALEHGIPRIGFVALMKVNNYCREHFIDMEEIHFEEIPHVYFTKSMNRGYNCKCSNYLYNKGLKILEIYMRNYANPQYCESSLVFDGEFLRQSFHQNNIIF